MKIANMIDEIKDHDHKAWIRRSLYRSLSDCKKRAKRKKITCTLTHDDLDHLMFINFDRCCVTGMKFRRREKEHHLRNPYAPSIDRIDNSIGYNTGNVRIVASCVNNAMNEWGEDIIKEIATSYKNWNTHP